MDMRRVLLVIVLAVVALGCLPAPAAAGGRSLRFFGTGANRVDRVEIRLDGPARPVDVGAGAFTIEWWMRARAADNTRDRVGACGEYRWINGQVIVDRDRWPTSGADGRDFGVSITGGGDVAFGAQNGVGASHTVCTALPGRGVLDDRWHHVAVQRGSGGRLQVWVDGLRRANAAGPTGDLSYPDGVAGARATDPFLVLGAEKHDAGPAYPSYSGKLDELRVSSIQRYATTFTPRRRPFIPDAATVGLYHFDEATGGTVRDASGAAGGPSHGVIRRNTAGTRPARVTDTPF